MGKGPLQMQSVPQPKAEDQPAPGAKFPAHVHRRNAETGQVEAKDVANDEELKAALKDGWVADVRDVPESTPAQRKAKTAPKKARKK